LINRLLVDAKRASPVGGEDHRPVVGGPVVREVLTVVERETPRLGDCAGIFESRNIDVGLWNSFHIRDALAVARQTHAEYISLIIRKAHGSTLWLELRIQPNRPEV